MHWLVDAVSALLLLSGCFFVVTGSIGLLRLPDVFCRLHAASVADTLGAALISGGLMLQAGLSLLSLKLLLMMIIIFFTSPVASYALARAALQAGIKPKQSS